jgi:hypothetical protein
MTITAAQALHDLFFHTQGGVSVGSILIALGGCCAFAALAASADENRPPGYWDPPDEPTQSERDKFSTWYGRRLP